MFSQDLARLLNTMEYCVNDRKIYLGIDKIDDLSMERAGQVAHKKDPAHRLCTGWRSRSVMEREADMWSRPYAAVSVN